MAASLCASPALTVFGDKTAVTRDFSLHILAARAKVARYADPEFVPGLGACVCVRVM